MESRKMLTILVLGLVVWSAPMVYAAQYLTVNGQDVDSITLEVRQTCTVEVVSDDDTSYGLYIGFVNGRVLGRFSHLQTTAAAGEPTTVTEYNQPTYYGYHVVADGFIRRPRPGVHFIFEYEAQQVGGTDVLLAELIKGEFVVIDSVHITVTTPPTPPEPMGTAFTYQGRLMDTDNPADGLYDFEFKLYHAPNGGIQEGNTIDINDVDVIDGYFAVELDFGSDPNIFNGDARWLEFGVRPGDFNDPCDYTILEPRVELTPTPYAIYAKSAGGDGDWTISGNDMYSAVSGNVGIGTTSPAEKLDVNGNININSVYKIGGDSVLSVLGTENILVGIGAGANISSGERNSAIGDYALNANTTGTGNSAMGFNALRANTSSHNSAVGAWALSANTTGSNNIAMGYNALGQNNEGYYNSAVGHAALCANTKGLYNSAVGAQAGYSNTTGSYNTFSGYRAGYSNTKGYYNTFLGREAGRSNTEGYYNTFVGDYAGYSNTTGRYNTFLGREAGVANTGYYNTFLGYRAGYYNQTGGGNVFIGYKAGYNETGSNKLYITNSDADPPLIYGDFSTGRVGIGTDSPTQKLDVAGNIAASWYCDRDNAFYYMDPANTDTSARFAGRVRVRVLEITGGSDLSEQFEVSGEGGQVKPGMVVCIDADNSGSLVVSKESYDRTVAGIVSGAGGIKPGMLMGQKGTKADGEHPVALTGRVYCWADASNGPIEPGDLLTTSDMAGHAMKVTDYTKAQGAILGKAMSSLESGKGLVLVLVSLQ